MLQFLYTGDYDTVESANQEEREGYSVFSFHAEMYAIADKYDIDDLAALAVSKYRGAIAASRDGISFLRSISCVYTSTTDKNLGLRQVVMEAAKTKLWELA